MKREEGFTLVELMIVVAIIGILAAVAIPQFAAYRIRGFNSAAQSDVKNLSTSEAVIFADWQMFGITLEAANDAAAILATTPRAAAGVAIPGAAVVGGNGVALADYIGGQDAGLAGRFIPLGISNGVTLFAHSVGIYSSFTAGAKHLQGNTCYTVDSDTPLTYQAPTLVLVGTAIAAGHVPASTDGTDNLATALPAGTWTVK